MCHLITTVSIMKSMFYLFKTRNTWCVVRMKSIFFTIVLFFFSFLQIGFCQDVLDDNNFVTINEDITQYGITMRDIYGLAPMGTDCLDITV